MPSTLAPTLARARRSRLRRVVLGLLAAVMILTLMMAGLALWSVRRPFPQHEGAVSLPGLDGPVEVYRDEVGIPHVFAATSSDLFRAQGYLHAQDRFWQMDVWRHIGAGRTAELLGPPGLEADRFLRTLGWERVAREELGLMEEATRDILTAYASGVNAYLQGRAAPELGLEYTILGLQMPGYEPAPWELHHTLTFLKLMAWDLRSNFEDELQRGLLTATLTQTQLEELYPPYPDHAPVIAPQTTAAPGSPVAGSPHELADGDRAPIAAALERVAAAASVTGAPQDGIGSNSWVISGERTDSGLPILANDPHLSIQIPSIWYQIGLHCVERTPRCQDEVAGFSFAGMPGVVIGHNDRVAWGFTNLAPDVMDLYVERVNPSNPDQYLVDGRWVDMEVDEETLRAADGTIETLRVRTTRHGPVISDSYGLLDEYDPPAGLGAGESYAVALRWTALDPGRTIDALPAINRARNWEEFREAASRFEVPAQNMIYADVDGTIGYQAPGRIPIRRRGDGQFPVPGWNSEYEWTGFIPFEELPSERDPERGWIVTANNLVAGPGYPHHLTSDWAYGYRARRIEHLLEAAGARVSSDEIAAIQTDAHDSGADVLVPALLAVDSRDPDIRQAQRLLRDWDRQASADSAAAALYAATWRHLLLQTFADRLPESVPPVGGSRWFAVVGHLLDQPDNAWWDSPDAGISGRDQALPSAMGAAVEELSERLGEDPAQWRWGDLHRATFRNGTLGTSGISLLDRRFNRGPYPVSGGTSSVNATAWDASAGYEVVALPSMRMVVDLGDLDATHTISPPGQSGHAYHQHYTDMIASWQSGEMRPLPWSREAVEAVAVNHLRLLPR